MTIDGRALRTAFAAGFMIGVARGLVLAALEVAHRHWS